MPGSMPLIDDERLLATRAVEGDDSAFETLVDRYLDRTFNVALRMESTGVVGRVQVSEAVVAAAGDSDDFESRGKVAVKGKGEMEVFLLA